MATKRKTYFFRQGNILEVEEDHDGRYGAPGECRQKRKKPTKEQMRIVNALNKAKLCRWRLLEYFTFGDCFATWTYTPRKRPNDMKEALKDFQKAIGKVRKEYKKRGKVLRWIRNIERGTKGAWHIHLIVNEIGDTASVLQRAWDKGGTFTTEIRKSEKFYDEDFTELANYMTKDEYTREKKKNGEPGKPRIRGSNYNTSRNMPLPEPKKDRLVKWRDEPKPKKGYCIAKIHEGINPFTGYKYRRYTMIRIKKKAPETNRRC